LNVICMGLAMVPDPVTFRERRTRRDRLMAALVVAAFSRRSLRSVVVLAVLRDREGASVRVGPRGFRGPTVGSSRARVVALVELCWIG